MGYFEVVVIMILVVVMMMIPMQTFLLSERLRKSKKRVTSNGIRHIYFHLEDLRRQRLSCLSWLVMWGNESFFVDHVATCGWWREMTPSCYRSILRWSLFVGKSNNNLFDLHVNALMDVFLVVTEHTHCWRCFGKKGSQHSCLETQSKEANICASILEIQTIFK